MVRAGWRGDNRNCSCRLQRRAGGKAAAKITVATGGDVRDIQVQDIQWTRALSSLRRLFLTRVLEAKPTDRLCVVP
jgi:hypothetical protein